MRYGFIARHRPIWPVRTMCRMLKLSHAGFYDWHGRSPSVRSIEGTRLTGIIRTSFVASDGTYGALRVARDLRD